MINKIVKLIDGGTARILDRIFCADIQGHVLLVESTDDPEGIAYRIHPEDIAHAIKAPAALPVQKPASPAEDVAEVLGAAKVITIQCKYISIGLTDMLVWDEDGGFYNIFNKEERAASPFYYAGNIGSIAYHQAKYLESVGVLKFKEITND